MDHRSTDTDVFFARLDNEGDTWFAKVVAADDRPLTPYALLRFVEIEGETFQFETSFYRDRGRVDVAAVKYVRAEV